MKKRFIEERTIDVLKEVNTALTAGSGTPVAGEFFTPPD